MSLGRRSGAAERALSAIALLGVAVVFSVLGWDILAVAVVIPACILAVAFFILD